MAVRIYVDTAPHSSLHLDVRDDGVGYTTGNATRRYGVLGMRERAQHFGGVLAMSSAPGRGVRVRLAMPLPADVPS